MRVYHYLNACPAAQGPVSVLDKTPGKRVGAALADYPKLRQPHFALWG